MIIKWASQECKDGKINQDYTSQKTNTKISRRKEIIKIREEINEKEMKETILKINRLIKLKAVSLRR